MNLLPERFARQQACRERLRRAARLAVVAASLTLCAALWSWHEQHELNALIADQEHRITAAGPAYHKAIRVERQRQEWTRELARIAPLSDEPSASCGIALVCGAIPDRVTLTGLTLERGPMDLGTRTERVIRTTDRPGAARQTAAAGPPIRLRLTGLSRGGEPLWRFVHALAAAPGVASARLLSSGDTDVEGQTVTRFQIFVEVAPESRFVVPVQEASHDF